jgi:hypothetical protein
MLVDSMDPGDTGQPMLACPDYGVRVESMALTTCPVV